MPFSSMVKGGLQLGGGLVDGATTADGAGVAEGTRVGCVAFFTSGRASEAEGVGSLAVASLDGSATIEVDGSSRTLEVIGGAEAGPSTVIAVALVFCSTEGPARNARNTAPRTTNAPAPIEMRNGETLRGSARSGEGCVMV